MVVRAETITSVWLRTFVLTAIMMLGLCGAPVSGQATEDAAARKAQAECELKFGSGARAEQELDFGEVSFVCSCASPYRWNANNSACVTGAAGETPQFDRTYGGEKSDYIYSFSGLKAGGYLASGTVSVEVKDGFHGWLSKLGPNGEQVWQKMFEKNGFGIITEAIELSDGDLAFVAIFRSDAKRDEFETWLVRLDASGERIWERKITKSDQYSYAAIAEYKNSELLVASPIAAKPLTDADVMLVRFDRSGKSVWRKKFDGGEGDFVTDLQVDDASILMLGYSEDETETNYRTWFVKLNQDAEIQWEKSYGSKGRNVLVSLKVLPNNNLIASGNKPASQKDTADFWVIQLSPSGDVVWDKTYNRASFNESWGLALTKQGQIVVAGNSGKKQSRPADHGWIIWLDLDGKKLSEKVISSPGGLNLYYMTARPEGGVVASGGKKVKDREMDIWIFSLPPLAVSASQ